jgi:hypothetical protein
MTKCPYCSEPVPDEAATCPACAEPLVGKDNEPPTPADGQHESKRSTAPERSTTKVVCLLILAVGVLAFCVHLATQYPAFTNQLTAVDGVRIGDARAEVKYRLGFPQTVLGPLETDDPELRGFQRVYTVSAPTNDVNRMPPTTRVEGYGEWVYEEVARNVRLTIEFNKAGLVESLDLYSDIDKPQGWGPVAGLYSGDSEEQVLRFGVPSKQHLDGVTKTIEYADLGLKITLTKGKAYMVTLKGVPQNSPAVFWRYIRQ